MEHLGIRFLAVFGCDHPDDEEVHTTFPDLKIYPPITIKYVRVQNVDGNSLEDRIREKYGLYGVYW